MLHCDHCQDAGCGVPSPLDEGQFARGTQRSDLMKWIVSLGSRLTQHRPPHSIPWLSPFVVVLFLRHDLPRLTGLASNS